MNTKTLIAMTVAGLVLCAGFAPAQEGGDTPEISVSYPHPPDETNWDGQFHDPENTKLIDGRPAGNAKYSVIWAPTTVERFIDVDLGQAVELDRMVLHSYKHYTGRDFQLDHVRLYLTEGGPEGPWELYAEQEGYRMDEEKGTRTFEFDAPDRPIRYFRFGVQNDEAIHIPVSEVDAFARDAPEVSYVLSAKFTEVFHEPEGPEPTPTADQREAGYILFAPHWMRKVFGNSVPLEGEIGAGLSAFAAPGEYEPMTLAIYPLEDPGECTLAVSDLSGPDGASISAGSIDVRIVNLWAQIPGQKGSAYAEQYIVTPEALFDTPTIEVDGEDTREWWITVNVPDDAAPGQYTGTATLTPGDGPAAEVPVTFEVLPVTLREPEGYAFGMYWGPYRQDDMTEERIQAQLDDMREHNMNSVALTAPATMSIGADGQYEYDLEAVTELLQKLRDNGLDAPVPWIHQFPPLETEFGTDEHAAQVNAFVEYATAHFAERGLGEVLWYPRDEPWHGERREQCNWLLEQIKQVPGVRTYTTTQLETAIEFGPWLDVRCHTLSLSGGFDPVAVRESAAAGGDTYWWYTNACREYPDVMRFKGGFFFYKTGATGQFYWAYQYPRSNPIDDRDGIDWCAAYPGETEPIPTIEWEGLREGIDDFRFVHTLELEIADARAGGSAAAKTLADEAEALLDEIREAAIADLQVYEELGLNFHVDSIWEPETYDTYRRRIAEKIAALQAAE
ncbi:MAG: glycoside hydrolase domain-containing protein [Armatimonadota bacterium]